jgi:hypothetical protein
MLPTGTVALTYRPRRYGIWFLTVIATFLLAVPALFITVAIATGDTAAGGAGFITGVIMGLPGLWMAWLAYRTASCRITLSPASLDLRTHRFSVWGLRPIRQAHLPWDQVYGVQTFRIPNFAAPDGVQIDYIIHTSAGKFAVANVAWNEAAEIAQRVCDQIQRPLDDLAPAATEVRTDAPSDRIGIRLMRALGWCSMAIGWLFLALVPLMWLGNRAIEPKALVSVGMMGSFLIMIGRSVRNFKLSAGKTHESLVHSPSAHTRTSPDSSTST